MNRSLYWVFNRAMGLLLLAVGGFLLLCIWPFHRLFCGTGFTFKQTRIGRFGKTITIYKVRTFHCPDEPIDHWFAKALRRLKIDELPQAWSVTKAEMNIVGPRPLVPSEADQHSAVRTWVLPGMVSLWLLGIPVSDEDFATSRLLHNVAVMFIVIIITVPAILIGVTRKSHTDRMNQPRQRTAV